MFSVNVPVVHKYYINLVRKGRGTEDTALCFGFCFVLNSFLRSCVSLLNNKEGSFWFSIPVC